MISEDNQHSKGRKTAAAFILSLLTTIILIVGLIITVAILIDNHIKDETFKIDDIINQTVNISNTTYDTVMYMYNPTIV